MQKGGPQESYLINNLYWEKQWSENNLQNPIQSKDFGGIWKLICCKPRTLLDLKLDWVTRLNDNDYSM